MASWFPLSGQSSFGAKMTLSAEDAMDTTRDKTKQIETNSTRSKGAITRVRKNTVCHR